MPTMNSTLSCHWCGVSLAGAAKITYLNGNLPVCDLCLMKAKSGAKRQDYNLANPYDASILRKYRR